MNPKLLLLTVIAGCAATGKVAVLTDPLVEKPAGPVVPDKIAPSLRLELDGVDLTQMGLYVAPNVIPALQPGFLPSSASLRPLVSPAGTPVPAVAAPSSSGPKGLSLVSAASPAGGHGASGGEATSSEPPAWLIQRAAGGDPKALEVLRRWVEGDGR